MILRPRSGDPPIPQDNIHPSSAADPSILGAKDPVLSIEDVVPYDFPKVYAYDDDIAEKNNWQRRDAEVSALSQGKLGYMVNCYDPKLEHPQDNIHPSSAADPSIPGAKEPVLSIEDVVPCDDRKIYVYDEKNREANWQGRADELCGLSQGKFRTMLNCYDPKLADYIAHRTLPGPPSSLFPFP